MDTDSLSADDLLAFLSPAQREAFDITLRDPSKLSALVEEEFEQEIPWWETVQELGQTEQPRQNPNIVSQDLLPPLKMGEDGKAMVNPSLVYNILAIL